MVGDIRRIFIFLFLNKDVKVNIGSKALLNRGESLNK
jgi:hypothetical protein